MGQTLEIRCWVIVDNSPPPKFQLLDDLAALCLYRDSFEHLEMNDIFLSYLGDFHETDMAT